MIVVRQGVSKEVNIGTFAKRVLRAIRPLTRRVSHLQPLSVGGEPAFALDYFVTGSGRTREK